MSGGSNVLLSQIEKRLKRPQRIGLEVLIEEVEAIIHVEEIARSSSHLEAIIFGPFDYAASQGVDSKVIGGYLDTYPGDLWHYARNKIVIAAVPLVLTRWTAPISTSENPDGYRRECVRCIPWALWESGLFTLRKSTLNT